MRYLLLICFGDSAGTSEESIEALGDCGGWADEMARRGVLLSGAGLQPGARATTVRARGDEVLLGDGPFAETKDQIGGFNLIECRDLDEAIEIAAAHPAAQYGTIEIRPVWES